LSVKCQRKRDWIKFSQKLAFNGVGQDAPCASQ
jgi:hypothetical protein